MGASPRRVRKVPNPHIPIIPTMNETLPPIELKKPVWIPTLDEDGKSTRTQVTCEYCGTKTYRADNCRNCGAPN